MVFPLPTPLPNQNRIANLSISITGFVQFVLLDGPGLVRTMVLHKTLAQKLDTARRI